MVPTAGAYYSLGCYGEKPQGRALPDSFTDNSMTVEMCVKEANRRQLDFAGVEYGTECWMGDVLDDLAKPLAQDKCEKLCPGNQDTWCGGSSTLQMYRVNATLLIPLNATPAGPLSCPDSDDTAWTASDGKSRFRIECGWDRGGGSQARVTAETFEDCLNACAKYTGCKSVALLGQDCYIKTGTLGAPERRAGLRGATLLK